MPAGVAQICVVYQLAVQPCPFWTLPAYASVLGRHYCLQLLMQHVFSCFSVTISPDSSGHLTG